VPSGIEADFNSNEVAEKLYGQVEKVEILGDGAIIISSYELLTKLIILTRK